MDAAVLLISAVAVLAVGPGAASPAPGDQIELSFDSVTLSENAWNVLVPNFERAYPNVTVNLTYSGTTAQNYAARTTELAAGNGTDLLNGVARLRDADLDLRVCEGRLPGTTREQAVAEALAPARDVGRASTVRACSCSPRTSRLFGIFTNDTLFRKLDLTPPQTFSQLLAVCQKAKADGVVPDGARRLGLGRGAAARSPTSRSRPSTRRTHTGSPS